MSVAIECANCGVMFWLTDGMHGQRRNDHETFYCPNGHPNVYPRPRVTAEEKEIAELKRIVERRAESYRRTHETLEEWKRAARVCPLCEEHVTKAQFVETIRAKVAEHLRDEHGARPRLRAITEKAGEAR